MAPAGWAPESEDCVHIPALSLGSCVTPGQWLQRSERQSQQGRGVALARAAGLLS